MRRSIPLVLLILALPGAVRAQSKPHPKPDADRLGMTCAQILTMSSTEWVHYVGEKTHLDAANMPYDLLRGNAAYGRCYDARTDALAGTLARNGKGPSRAARADFAAFETALKGFAAKALADGAMPADDQKKSYAALYEKQFRYEFYQEYEARNAVRPSPAATKSSAPAAAPSAHPDSAPPADSARSAAAQEQARSDADPMTMAKNHFGKLLDALPDDKMHELHQAFGEVVGPYSISAEIRLTVYRYAVFLLESPPAAPFAPPPF